MTWRSTKRKEGVVLLNQDKTRISFSPKSRPNIVQLFKKMNALNVPFKYTKGLKEIRFTRLPGLAGDYLLGRIRMSVDAESQKIFERILVHELAHHVDDVMQATKKSPLLSNERKEQGQYMPDGYAKKNVCEYFACGFEVYYCGSEQEKKTMSEKNPILHSLIEELHRRYTASE